MNKGVTNTFIASVSTSLFAMIVYYLLVLIGRSLVGDVSGLQRDETGSLTVELLLSNLSVLSITGKLLMTTLLLAMTTAIFLLVREKMVPDALPGHERFSKFYWSLLYSCFDNDFLCSSLRISGFHRPVGPPFIDVCSPGHFGGDIMALNHNISVPFFGSDPILDRLFGCSVHRLGHLLWSNCSYDNADSGLYGVGVCNCGELPFIGRTMESEPCVLLLKSSNSVSSRTEEAQCGPPEITRVGCSTFEYYSIKWIPIHLIDVARSCRKNENGSKISREVSSRFQPWTKLEFWRTCSNLEPDQMYRIGLSAQRTFPTPTARLLLNTIDTTQFSPAAQVTYEWKMGWKLELLSHLLLAGHWQCVYTIEACHWIWST